MSKSFDIKKFNSTLKEYNQVIYATSITGSEIILSNGLRLTSEADIRRCKRRVMTGASVWKEHFDRLYSTDKEIRQIAETECKSLTSKNGGKVCQKKHGEKLRLNLNSGVPWNKGLKGNYPYSHACGEATKKKISNANAGKKNGMYGTKMSAEEKVRRSVLLQDLILCGKFTPNSNNRNTHWDAFYKGKKYRSSWEALYQYFDVDAEYETVRITYLHNNNPCIYIVDFVNHKTKTLIEVKPKELLHNQKTQAKIDAAKQWCKDRQYEFIIVDKDYFLNLEVPVDLKDFDSNTQQKIRKMYETSK